MAAHVLYITDGRLAAASLTSERRATMKKQTKKSTKKLASAKRLEPVRTLRLSNNHNESFLRS
jgi:hypothetical protein